jgi:exosortase
MLRLLARKYFGNALSRLVGAGELPDMEFTCTAEPGMTFSEAMKHYRIPLLLILFLVAGLYSSVIPDMALEWYRDDNYSHGFLVPIIAAYFLYRNREEVQHLAVAPSNLGLPVILLALLLLIVATLCTEYYTLRSSLVVLLAGLVLYLFGTGIFRKVSFSILFLIFMVPLPKLLYNTISLPLKLFVSKVAVGFMQLIGMTVVREGNIIMLPNSTLEVVGACSGIRSLLSLLTLSTAYAFLLPATPLKRLLIILSAVPLAIIMNAVRVVETGILVQQWGAAMAEGLVHELAGMAVFMLSLVLLIGFGRILCGSTR